MQTFWIILIGILVLIGLAIMAIVIWYFFRRNRTPSSPSAPPTPPTPLPIKLNYKDGFQLISKYNKVPLATCRSGNSEKCISKHNVALPTTTDRFTRQWRIFYQQDNDKDGPVRYGDKIILKNLYGPDLNLSACGITKDGCGVNVTAGRKEGEPDADIWTIIGSTIGKNVMYNDEVQLRSEYGEKLLLSACGYYLSGKNRECGSNVSLRDDNGGGPDSRLWTITK